MHGRFNDTASGQQGRQGPSPEYYVSHRAFLAWGGRLGLRWDPACRAVPSMVR